MTRRVMCGPLDHGLVAEALQDDSGRPLQGLGREVDHRNPRTTTMPSSSECTVCPGVIHTPPIFTGPLTTPTPVLLLFWGLVPEALIPRSSRSRATLSRTAPEMTIPAQPRCTATSAMRSPTSAERNDPPPSTTSTLPLGSRSSSNVDLTKALSSKHFTVTAGPANRDLRPKLRNWTGIEARASP